MVDKDVLEKLKKLTEKDIEKLSTKLELTPEEHRSLKNALASRAMIEAEYNKLMSTDYENEASGRRMRNPMTGRYTPSYGYYDNGYSGHSIRDRAVAKLEQMMGEATNDYERHEITQMIERIR